MDAKQEKKYTTALRNELKRILQTVEKNDSQNIGSDIEASLSPEGFALCEHIIRNRATMSREEIIDIYNDFPQNRIIVPLLFECENVPTEIIEHCVQESLKSLKENPPVSTNFAKEILNADYPERVLDEIDIDFIPNCIRLATSCSQKTIIHMPNSAKEEMVKWAFTNTKSGIFGAAWVTKKLAENVCVIKPDKYITEEALSDLVYELAEDNCDMLTAIQKTIAENADTKKLPENLIRDLRDRAEHIKQLNGYLLMSYGLSEDATKLILGNGDVQMYSFPYYSINGFTIQKQKDEIYEYVMDRIENGVLKENHYWAVYGEIVAPLQMFWEDQEFFDTAHLRDTVERLSDGYGRNISENNINTLTSNLLRCYKGVMDDSVVQKFYDMCVPSIKTSVLCSGKISEDARAQCVEKFLETTARKGIKKSNNTFFKTLAIVAKHATLPPKRYEDILNSPFNDPKSLPKGQWVPAHFTELVHSIKTSAKTPIELLQKFNDESVIHFGTASALYAAQHKMNEEQLQALNDLALGEYEGGKGRTRSNVNIVLNAVNNGIDVPDYLEYIKSLDETRLFDTKNPKLNIPFIEQIYNDLKSVDFDRNAYLKKVAPSQFFVDAKAPFIKSISENEEGEYFPPFMITKNAVLAKGEYFELCECRDRPEPTRETVAIEQTEAATEVKIVEEPEKSAPEEMKDEPFQLYIEECL